jgi:hypothetical protein
MLCSVGLRGVKFADLMAPLAVDFFYSLAHKDAVDLDEIRNIADRHPSLRVHLVCADTDRKLTLGAARHDASPGLTPWVYMCGPPAMMKAFSSGFRTLGVPAGYVRWDQLDVRWPPWESVDVAIVAGPTGRGRFLLRGGRVPSSRAARATGPGARIAPVGVHSVGLPPIDLGSSGRR